MMRHTTEEELIGYREGERNGREQIAAHLEECGSCRQELAAIETVYAAIGTMPVPDPGDGYPQRVWQQISPRLQPRAPRWWEGLFNTRQLAAGALAGAIVLAFVVGRITKHPDAPGAVVDVGKVRERVLVVAVSEHLGKSEMVLMELENAPSAVSGQKLVNISATQHRAESLLEENRLYRQTALHEGNQAMASTLDDLERVLLDIANSPDTVTPAQFESMRKRILDRGILFQVRVVHRDLQQRNKALKTGPIKKTPANAGGTKAAPAEPAPARSVVTERSKV